MECRLKHSDEPWKCQVWLRWETDTNGNKITPKEVPFGPLLHDKGDLELMIRRAQLAILNPSLPETSFFSFDIESLGEGEHPDGSKRQFQFSESVVCLNISGQDLTDLSFIDLPGK